MSHAIILRILLLVLLSFSLVYTDNILPPPMGFGPGYDYFTTREAKDTNKDYLELVTRVQADKIVEWISQGRLDNAVLDVRSTVIVLPITPKGFR
jgi:hypothetical protein